MSYQYDIFLSYQRDPETLRWIKNHLIPLLTVRLKFELGRAPDIFIDEQIEAGTSWPIELATKLAASRILIPLWTRTYFSSKWCSEEFCQMLGRENETSRRTIDNPHGLVVPAVIHDCEDLSPELGHIQYFRISECFNVRMAFDSTRAEELDAVLDKESLSIANAINNAPQWQSSWSSTLVDDFLEIYYEKNIPRQHSIPGFAT